MEGIAPPSVGIEWFVEEQPSEQIRDANDAPHGITSPNDLFLRTNADNTSAENPGHVMMEKGLAYDRISLKVRNATKRLLSPDARKARCSMVSAADASASTLAPKWLRET
jgi:hypothetical protein